MTTFKYRCDKCGLKTNNLSQYKNHLLTKKHTRISLDIFKYECKNCSKKYNANSSFWQHKQTCKNIENDATKETLIKSIKEEIQICFEKLPHPTQTINNITNINFLLNEKLPIMNNLIDVMQKFRIDDTFRTTIEADITDGNQKGYVLAMSNLLKREFDKIPILERPIFCINDEDENQKIVHVYDNNRWKKETELEWTNQIHEYFDDDFKDDDEHDKKKMVFFAFKQVQNNILEQLREKYGSNKSIGFQPFINSNKRNMNWVPNILKTLKYMVDNIIINKKDLLIATEKL